MITASPHHTNDQLRWLIDQTGYEVRYQFFGRVNNAEIWKDHVLVHSIKGVRTRKRLLIDMLRWMQEN